MNNDFYTIDNLKLIVNIFKDYMLETFEYNIEDESSVRKLLYEIMTKINEEFKNTNLKIQEKNIHVMNIAKDIYIKKYKLDKNKKINIQSLQREKNIYGDRKNHVTTIIPEIDNYKKKHINDNDSPIEKIIYERNKEVGIESKNLPTVDKLINPINDKAETKEDFLKKLKNLELQRNLTIENIEKKNEEDKGEIKEILINNKNNLFSSNINSIYNNDSKILYEKNINKEYYILINSFERELLHELNRYKYSIKLNNKYKNIHSIYIDYVIIPNDILQNDYNLINEYSISFPYIIVSIDELENIYDGLNNNIKNAIGILIYYKTYNVKTVGRSYSIFKAINETTKVFNSIIPSIDTLTISLYRPNGRLINYSTDSYKIITIEYDDTHINYLKVITDNYFDKNDYAIGDIVIFNNYVITKLSVYQKENDIELLNNYINSPRGFTILELGENNGYDYYNSFYIKAPGAFNKSTGQYHILMNLVNCLNYYNGQITTKKINGNIMNYSLQNSISMKLIGN